MGRSERVILDFIVLWGVLHMVQGTNFTEVTGALGDDRVFDPNTVSGINVLTNYIAAANIMQCCSKCQTINQDARLFVFSKTSSHCACLSPMDGVQPATTDPGNLQGWMPQPVAGVCDEKGSEVFTEETLELGSGYEEMSEEPMNVGISLGYGNTEVEEILLEAELEHLENANANLKRKIQMMDTQLLNMQNLEKLNEKIAQENFENMRENENLIMKKKMQAIEIEQLHENLQSSQNKGTILQNKLTKTIQNLKNVTENAKHLESQLATELELKSTYQEEAQIEHQMHGITKQQLVDSRNLIKVSMNFTKLLSAHISQRENMTDPLDMRSTINQMKTKENLYMAENLAYQNETHVLRNVTSTERHKNQNLINSMTQQGKLEKLKERMINILQSSLMEMARTIPNCTTITTQELEAQLDAVLEEEDPLKQLISQCSIFNQTSANLQNLYVQHNTQLKEQLATKLNVINHHIEENREFFDALEETKQLANIQSQSLKLLTSEMDRLLPNGITRVQRNADGNIESVYLCQCIPEAPKASELEISAIQWTCTDDKAVNPQLENTFSHTCPGSDCSVEASSFPQCQDVLEKGWSSWEYFDCIEVEVGNETILCGNGNRSRSREVRSPFANSWRSEDVWEQCSQCSLTAASSAVAISPPALEAALKTVMEVADQVWVFSPTKSTSCDTVCSQIGKKCDREQIRTATLDSSCSTLLKLFPGKTCELCSPTGATNTYCFPGNPSEPESYRSKVYYHTSFSSSSYTCQTIPDKRINSVCPCISPIGNSGCMTTPSRPDSNGSPSKPNTKCIFPFTFNGQTYSNCASGSVASTVPDDSFWCSTKVDSRGKHVSALTSGQGEWGYCNQACSVSVSCGSHHAATCQDCPQGHGESWCHGDCRWANNQCTQGSRSKRPTKVTLVGGSSPNEGNVFYNGKPVCDDAWPRDEGGYGNNNGAVVCRELGYSGLVRFYDNPHFGNVPDSFSMDDVKCTGTESKLEDCPHSTDENCGASEAVGVVCTV